VRAIVKARPGRGALERREVPDPEPGPDEALIEVAYAGLCGSDAGIYEFYDAYEVMDLPTVIGHEYAGRVVAVGEDVTAVEPGDRVVDRVLRACGECYQCRSGATNVCANTSVAGVHEDGAFAEYVAVPARSLHRVPEGLGLRDAALAEPTAVAVRAAGHHADLAPGDRVLVQGPGPIGLLSAQVARAAGAEILVSGTARDRSHRLPLARELGFETVDVEEDALGERVDGFTDGVGVDVVVDATGHPSGLPGAAGAVRPGGRVVVVGIPGEVTVDATSLVRAEVDVQCSYAYTWTEFERALRALAAGQVDAPALVDEGFDLADPAAAFEAFLDGDVCKVVFDVENL